MKYLVGNYYIGVKDHRYRIHPTEKILLRLCDEPKSLRTRYQVQNETQIRRNQKIIKNDNNQVVVRVYPKSNQPNSPQPKFKPPNCPKCKQNISLKLDKGFYCKNCEYIINKQKYHLDTKVFRQDHDFLTRLNYANKK